MAAFPQELFDLIVSLVPDDARTLNSIALSSSILYPCAQRRLFHCYSPDRWSHSGSPWLYTEAHYTTFIAFLETIITHPTLASYVHEISCPHLPFERRSPTWMEPLTRAIPLMPNLKLLTIHTDDAPYAPLLSALAKSNLALERFQWNWFNQNPDLNDTQLMSTFLSHQTQLRSLSLYMNHVTIPTDACPNVTQLATYCDNLLTMLPGRPIDTLYLDPDDPTLEIIGIDSSILDGLRNIRRLSLGISTMWAKDLLRLFPNLEVLTTQIGTNPRDYHLIISHFPNLTTIHFTQRTSFSEQGMMSTWLFKGLPKLRNVIWGRVTFDCWCPCSKPVSLTREQVDERMKLLVVT